jgi:hypothetical protein
LLRSVKGIIALKPFLAAILLNTCINSSRVEQRALKSSNSIVSMSDSLSIGISPEVAYLIEK